jgi:23S rRNA-/tRNA-specific pseudouridylate synthase
MENKGFFSWKVSSLERGMRLLSFIKDKTKSKSSNKFIKRTLEKGVCRVNGRVECFSSVVLEKGDFVQIYKNWEKIFLEKNFLIPFKILYEDEFLKVIDKKAFFISSEEEVNKFFKGRMYLVHRLDRETTGVLILAKSLKVKEKMIKENLFSGSRWNGKKKRRKSGVFFKREEKLWEGFMVSF